MNTAIYKLNDLNEAILTINGFSSLLVENREEAEYARSIITTNQLIGIYPGNMDFQKICAKLDLTSANRPRKVYRIVDNHSSEIGCIVFPDDWEMAGSQKF
ncbi:MAG: hypothetical protein HDS35_09890 [Bacteroides sp.]|nr:hypothetical protein [Bacteroides sp.]